MKKYGLLKLYGGGNVELAEIEATSELAAVKHFQTTHPELNLNDDGYAKHGDVSYCVAEEWDPFESSKKSS